MSKPLNKEIFIEFQNDLLKRKNEILLQVLNLLEIFRSNKIGKMARISSELTEILENENNLEHILKAKNLEELLNILSNLNKDKMIKVYEIAYLKEQFPNVMVDKFLK
ncbi:hypothetical protein N4T57_00730 [Campylobacter hepaticus]|uniref:Uncharacterized protein n=1 Tax=Campylobacter hepaticus TaxID=1813019 RepID=A0A424YZB5_9BACT|nr:hypothetical protein [Campylobacter hepaticus]AXP09197.1 hypothetical protein A2J15_005780 [Campylobacter hepaticus]MCZ0771701.1 hypothetical protein [Campylobacter hepaticus]MCZ0773170.1 hypothetical protein [Campylobacter hepaticus]MCZ0775849.1 hypothetical protein [Campylobacter hepaticus]MDX2323378.1 hypothetical protein [Campylobacter hepaticus]